MYSRMNRNADGSEVILEGQTGFRQTLVKNAPYT
jgi:hypothetical protein